MCKRILGLRVRLFVLLGFCLLFSSCNHGRPCVQPNLLWKIVKGGGVAEPYGATDINAVTGNRSLTVAENREGTITVFKWPSPSYYDHVKYMTTTREAERLGALPNEGVMTGLSYETESGRGFFWLREKVVDQVFAGERSVVVKTRYEAIDLGLVVEQVDFVLPNQDVIWREYRITKSAASVVKRASLVAYFNFSPQVSKMAFVPVRDWCLDELGSSRLEWEPRAELFIQSRAGLDWSGKRRVEVNLAFGFDSSTAAHHAGFDRACSLSRMGGKTDAFDLAGEDSWPGAHSAMGRVTAGLRRPLDFNPEGEARAAVLVSVASSRGEALAQIEETRKQGFDRAQRETEEFWQELLRGVPLPATNDARLREVALRSVIVLWLGHAKESGAGVASISTQPPYGLDWMRDGAYTNLALLTAGFPELVKARCRFWARNQSWFTHPIPFVPAGNWASNYFADGTPGFPLIWWEIDETGWALWSMVSYFEASRDQEYLAEVYPAIKKAADFLVRFRDPITGLPLPAYEDDNPRLKRSLHGTVPVFLGLKSAAKAAAAMADRRSQERWERRAEELKAVVLERNYDAVCGRFVWDPRDKGHCEREIADIDFGFLLWPAEMLEPDDPRAEQAASQVWASLEKSFNGERKQGSYEPYGLLILGRFWQNQPEKLELVKKGLVWSATGPITNTGLIGEVWFLQDGRYLPGQSQPQLWHHALFYLASLATYGSP